MNKAAVITPMPTPTPDPNDPAAAADALAAEIAKSNLKQEEKVEEKIPESEDKKDKEKKEEIETKPTPTPTPKPKKKASTGKQEVIIEALDSVSIRAKVDDKNSDRYSLKPGSIRTINANETIELEISDGGLVNIIHNGKDLGNPGDLGKTKKVKYP